jgi:hypothetical protein
MPDTFTEKTSQSWFSRIGGSFAGAVVGIIMMLVAFPMLWWNEGRAVRTAQGLAEGAGAVVSVAADTVDASRDGALVHVSGLATTTETLTDEEFGVAAPSLTLVRSVEMFQWREEKKSEKRKKLGGSEETTTTYTYRTSWSRTAIDSADFRQPDGHRNPGRLPWESKTIVAEQVTLGAFTLPRDLVATIAAREPLRIVASGAGGAAASPGVRAVDGGFYRGANPEAPAVGDVRIQYEVVNPQVVSVVAVQRGTSFEAYPTKAGTTILMLETGAVAANAMFKAAESSNRLTAWVLRAVGLFLMFLGLFLVFRPIAVVGSVVPMLGSLVGGGIGFVAFFVALALSLVTISLAWLAYRPMLAVGLLVVAAGGVVVVIRRQRAKKTAAGVSPPPLPPANPPRTTPPPLPPAS